jgi:protein TonB
MGEGRVRKVRKSVPLYCGLMLLLCLVSFGQERKAVHKVAPVYPEMMKKMNMGGTVKLRVTIRADGRVEEAEAVGGHPMLIVAATEAVRQWKYQPGPERTTTVVEITFDPSQH